MAYLKPALFTRSVFNRLAMRFGISGAVTLAVAGRRSGRKQTIPVIPVTVAGARYLISPHGEADWVKNIRASGGGELRDKGKKERFRISEIPVAERPPVLAAYQQAAGQAVKGNFAALPEPADHRVSRIMSASRSGLMSLGYGPVGRS